MKLFDTGITECQTYFSLKLPSTLLVERLKKLKDDYDLGHCIVDNRVVLCVTYVFACYLSFVVFTTYF